jgi:hypothetical protein
VAPAGKALRLSARKGRDKAFKITGGSTAPGTTDTMTLDQIERRIDDHIKPKR